MFKRHSLTLVMLSVFSLSAFSFNTNLIGFHDNANGSPILQMMDSAKETIRTEIYEMEDIKVHNAIRRALDRGVKVSIVQEPSPMGARCKIFTPSHHDDDLKCASLKSLVHDVNSRGGSYKPFDKKLCGIEGHSCFQHGKTVIIDGKIALVSTGNFNATNLCDLDQNPEVCNRDYSVVTDDAETVAALVRIHDADSRAEVTNFSTLFSEQLTDKLTVSPVSLDHIIDFISSARQTIRVQNQYLHEPRINKALVQAAKRGIKIEVTVSSLCWFEKPKPHQADRDRATFSSFDNAGISTRFFTRHMKVRGKDGYLHAKAIVVDGQRAWVGSMNGSSESAIMHREYGLFFNKREWVSELMQIMDGDHRNPNSESWQESLNCAKDHKSPTE